MAIPDFRTEKEFRDKWIGPFLSKLGFIVVKNTHGASEQGKDFYFAEYDRFGHTRVYAAQVKLGNIGTGSETRDILDQVKRCFEVPIRFHKSAHEQRIASVYVMTKGTISHEAKNQIHGWCKTEKMGENVFFLDGEQLDNKDRFATYQSDQEKRRLLTALRNELNQNRNQLKLQMDNLRSGRVLFFLCRLSSLDAVLQVFPGHADEPLIESMEYLYRTLSLFRSFVVPTVVDFDETQKDYFRISTEDSIARSSNLITYCDEELQKFDERYSLEITPVHDKVTPKRKRAAKI